MKEKDLKTELFELSKTAVGSRTVGQNPVPTMFSAPTKGKSVGRHIEKKNSSFLNSSKKETKK